MSVAQLNDAREVVQRDPSLYPEMIRHILPVADRPEAELKHWCALFLVNAFASASVPVSVKQSLAVQSLDAVTTLVHDKDNRVVQYAVVIVSEIYPLVFKHCCETMGADVAWQKVEKLKVRVLELWDKPATTAIHAACIKFGQVAILVQSGQQGSSPTDVSLQTVPKGHPFIDPIILAAEGAGLLDRILSYFGERDLSVQVFGATLNSVLPLMRFRSQMGPKVIQSLMTFDLNKKDLDCSGDATDLALKFIEKTVKLELPTIIQAAPGSQLSEMIQRFLIKFKEARANENLRKRAAGVMEQGDNKRAKFDQTKSLRFTATKLPAGPLSYNELYRLVDKENPLASFNAQNLHQDIAVGLVYSALKNVDQALLDKCLNCIKQRLSQISEAPKESPMTTVSEQTDARNSTPSAETVPHGTSNIEDIFPFKQGEHETQALRLTQQIIELAQRSVNRPTTVQAITQPAIPIWNSNSWIFIVARALSRAIPSESSVAKVLREHLYNSLTADFRSNLDIIVIWLNEEWYAETVIHDGRASGSNLPGAIYDTLVGRILDQLIPKLQLSDSKMFIRLVSELPSLTRTHIFKFRGLCLDPERSILGIRALKFLIMFKPPARSDCLNLLEALAAENVDGLANFIKRFRPEYIGPRKDENSCSPNA